MIKETKGLEQSREENINEYINNKENILNYLRLRFEHDKRLDELNFEHSKQLAPILSKLQENYVSGARLNKTIKLYTEGNINIDISQICEQVYTFIVSELSPQYRYFL